MKITISKLTEEFMFECSVIDSVDDVTRKIAMLHNLRLRVRRLVSGVRQLAKYGPMKHPDKYGLSEAQINAKGDSQLHCAHDDPLGMRVGKACLPTVAKTMEKCAADAEAAVSNELAKRRVATDVAAIKEALQNIKGAVMMAYPMGLPEWDVVRLAMEDQEDLSGQEDSKHVVDPESCLLWFAGKQMLRDQVMSKYVGKNDKCIIKAKLEQKGAGAPQREPAIDEETKKLMMARWYKKQEEEKRMAENAEDDAFAYSEWANPKSVKNSITGGGGEIRFR
jgi:hypothetical protein